MRLLLLAHLTRLTSARARSLLCRLGFVSFLPVLVSAVSLPSVPAPKESRTNTYHGVVVVDDYQWLEDASAPAVRDWTRLQNERTRAYFSRLTFREGLAQQLMQLRSEESARFGGFQEKKGRIFALRFKPPAQQPALALLSS